MYWFKLPVTDPVIRYNEELFFECLAYKKKRSGIVENIKGPEHYTFLFFYEQLNIGNGTDILLCPPNSFIICRPLQPRHYGDDNMDWTHTWFSFNGTFAEKLLQKYNIPIGVPQKLDNPFMAEKYVLQLHGEIFESESPCHDIVKNIFHNFVIELDRAMHVHTLPQIIPPAIRNIKNYMELNYSKRITLDELSKIANLSKSRIINLFREYFSVTPIEYILHLRLEEAKYLLIDVNLSISDVAREVGYSDIYYFSKQFKERFGQSPSQYRTHR